MARTGQLTALLADGKHAEAADLARTPVDYHEGEQFVMLALGQNPDAAAPELVIGAALEGFLASRQHAKPHHGGWVHSFSHFSGDLWQRRMMDWVRRLNELAFQGANELSDVNCSDRLITDYAEHARWDDDPAALGYTSANLAWVSGKDLGSYTDRAYARIQASPFATEAAYLRWEVADERLPTAFDYDAQEQLVNVGEIRRIRMRLAELGQPVDDLLALEQRILGQQIATLNGFLTTKREHFHQKIREGIAKREALLREYA